MKVLVTGGAGFIGSHLAEYYVNKRHEVVIIDNLSTGSLDNVSQLDIQLHIDTILNKNLMIELVSKADIVYHLAAAVGVKYILENPLESIKTNIQGTEIVLNLCSILQKRVLITSSSEVYGKHQHAPLVETDNSIYGPSNKSRWSYAASKLIDEFTALAYHRTQGLEVVIARLFNTTGPRQTGAYGMVVPTLVKQALHNESLTVYGSGSQTRTFTYVDDIVKCLVALMETDKAVGEVFNVGGTEEVSINDLAYRINNKIHIGFNKTKHIPYSEAFEKDFEDMQRRVPCLKKLERIIGFKPTTDLNTILDKVIRGYQGT